MKLTSCITVDKDFEVMVAVRDLDGKECIVKTLSPTDEEVATWGKWYVSDEEEAYIESELGDCEYGLELRAEV